MRCAQTTAHGRLHTADTLTPPLATPAERNRSHPQFLSTTAATLTPPNPHPNSTPSARSRSHLQFLQGVLQFEDEDEEDEEEGEDDDEESEGEAGSAGGEDDDE